MMNGNKKITLDERRVNRIKVKIIKMEQDFLTLKKTDSEKVVEIKKMIKEEVFKKY